MGSTHELVMECYCVEALMRGNPEAQIGEIRRGRPIYTSWAPRGVGGDNAVQCALINSNAELTLHEFEAVNSATFDGHRVRYRQVANNGRPFCTVSNTLVPMWRPGGHLDPLAVNPYTVLLEVANDVVLYDVKERQQIRVIFSAGNNDITYLSASPCGRYLAVLLDNLEGDLQLQVVSCDAPEQRMNVEFGTTIAAFFWNPTGTALAVACIPLGEQRLFWKVFRIEEHLWQQAEDQKTDHLLHLPPEIHPTGQFLQYLRFFEQYQQTLAFWSADGRFLTYPSVGDSGGQDERIVIVDADTMEVKDEMPGASSSCMSPVA